MFKDNLVQMRKLLQLTQEDLAEKLLATGDEELVEGNDWNDRIWGKVNGQGENRLGIILMKVREELRL